MFLVKSCFSKDNILSRKTIRIGTLDEYRHTVQAQIADREEGFIRLKFNLSDFMISYNAFNFINRNHESENSTYLHRLGFFPSPIIPNFLHLNEYTGETNLVKRNRYVFCISKLDTPQQYSGIFKDYEDQWNIKIQYSQLLAEYMAKQFLAEIKKRIENGDKLFTETPDAKKIEVKYTFGEVRYKERVININNEFLYKDERELINILTHGHFIKPKSFNIEREFRFVFDIYENNRILHPLERSIIINAEGILPLINLK